MHPFSDKQIADSLINATLRERKAMTLPADLASTAWEDLTYLGWRDPKLPQVGYVVADLDGSPTGVLLRRAEASPLARPQCSWCEDVQLPNDVVFFSAKRAGDAGRKGDTVGTLVCDEFQCSANVRRLPTQAYLGFDVEAERRRRIAALGAHVEGFVRAVLDGR